MDTQRGAWAAPAPQGRRCVCVENTLSRPSPRCGSLQVPLWLAAPFPLQPRLPVAPVGATGSWSKSAPRPLTCAFRVPQTCLLAPSARSLSVLLGGQKPANTYKSVNSGEYLRFPYFSFIKLLLASLSLSLLLFHRKRLLVDRGGLAVLQGKTSLSCSGWE